MQASKQCNRSFLYEMVTGFTLHGQRGRPALSTGAPTAAVESKERDSLASATVRCLR